MASQSKSTLRYAITGGAGFIGSHLVDLLLSDPKTEQVSVLDNFSSGRREHLSAHVKDSRLQVVEVELLDLKNVTTALEGSNRVVHLAANPDARWGIENTRLDLEQETIVTYNLLESMRLLQISQIVFSSSGTVYGDVGTEETHEKMGPALPVSLYGAGKVASEALISAFCGTFDLSAVIFRFGNIIGERTTHGVVFDFIRRLAKDSSVLEVLGNGHQAKPYVYVRDLVKGLKFGLETVEHFQPGQFDVFNIAPEGATSVRTIAATLVELLGLEGKTAIQYGESSKGWPGDVAQSRMNSQKLFSSGFQLNRSSDEAVRQGIQGILDWLRSGDRGAFEARSQGLILPA